MSWLRSWGWNKTGEAYSEEREMSQAVRLRDAGNEALRPTPMLLNPRFFACRDELWGRQSCLQRAFEPVPPWMCNPDEPAGKPAAAKIGCPHPCGEAARCISDSPG